LAAADEPVRTIFEVGTRKEVETLEGLITPLEFYEQYANLKDGKPVILKGAAKSMPAFKHWKDAGYLLEKFAKQLIGAEEVATGGDDENAWVKHKKKDTGVQQVETMTLAEFVNESASKPIYAVDTMPRAMAQHVFLLPMLNCGGFQAALSHSTLWWSTVQTKSRVHSDDFENINCQFTGRKRWALWHKKDLKKIRRKDMGWVKGASASGAFSSAAKLDVSNVSLEAFPGWGELERYDVTVEAGDCLFVPEDWAQTVWADGEGPWMSANLLFASPTSFDDRSCFRLAERGFKETDFLSTLRDCNYADTDVHIKITNCLKRARMPTGEETDERFYNVTGFCDNRRDTVPDHDMAIRKYVNLLDQVEKPVKQPKEEL